MSRLDRNRPLPEVRQPRVTDSLVQRALDGLFEPLRSVVEFLQPFVQPEKWKAITYQSTWSDSVPVNYRKDPLGRVWLRGSALRSGGALGNVTVLPLSYRPTATRLFHCPITGGTSALVQVQSDGVVLYSGAAGAVIVNLDPVSFDTEE